VVAQWHPPQESSLADIFAGVRPGEQAASAEIPLLIGGGLGQEGGWPLALEPGMAGEGQELGGISSLKGGETEARPRFWLNLNAELMIYGGTEPGASITLDGQPIQVRPDGTFSCRFALPDGHYEVIIGAMSEQGDVRQARLKFSRRTERQGEVGVRPSDESLGEMPKE
jgi:hypothetical protein